MKDVKSVKVVKTLKCGDVVFRPGMVFNGKIPQDLLTEVYAGSNTVEVLEEVSPQFSIDKKKPVQIPEEEMDDVDKFLERAETFETEDDDDEEEDVKTSRENFKEATKKKIGRPPKKG